MQNRTDKITDHHFSQFGHVNIHRLMTKLTEELGEVASDVYDWDDTGCELHRANALGEIGDCLIVLTVLANYLGGDIEDVFNEAADGFFAREF